jgi:hypothetical protein
MAPKLRVYLTNVTMAGLPTVKIDYAGSSFSEYGENLTDAQNRVYTRARIGGAVAEFLPVGVACHGCMCQCAECEEQREFVSRANAGEFN